MATTGVTPCMAHVLELLAQVGPSGLHLVGAFLEERRWQGPPGHDVVGPGVHLQRPDRRHDDRRVGCEARGPALDVEEPLRAHVGTEARPR